jgi:hypothetical protein
MATEKTANYNAAQENIIRSFKGTGTDGKLNFTDCGTIAAFEAMNDADGKPRTARAIASKISRMALPYEGKEKTRKDGTAVETKDKLVAQIAALSGVTFDALTKAARADLVKLRDVLAKAA